MRSPRVRMRRSRVRMRVRPLSQPMRVRPLSGFSVNRMVPNVLTLLALCAGMTAIRFAIGGNYPAAVCSIMVAGILDGLDGRIARLLKSTSQFGAELDSLSDFVSFGVAPAAVLYLWTMSALRGVGWAVVLLYAVCCALRLARFNAHLGDEPPIYAAGYFTGVPAPAGAWLVVMPMFMAFEWGDWIFRSPYLGAVWTMGVALLMVSTVPTVSLKRFRIQPRFVLPTLIAIGLLAGLMTAAPWPTLTVLGFVYLGSIPLTLRACRRRAAAEAHRTEPPEAAAGQSPLLPPFPFGEDTAPSSETRH